MGKRPLLTEQELADRMESLSGWKVEDSKWIVKTYVFPAFIEAVEFVNEVAEISERLNHHPFISIDYRRVTLRLTTWHSGGLTTLDIDSAWAYDK